MSALTLSTFLLLGCPESVRFENAGLGASRRRLLHGDLSVRIRTPGSIEGYDPATVARGRGDRQALWTHGSGLLESYLTGRRPPSVLARNSAAAFG